MKTAKNQGGGENLNTFTLNPAFLLQDMPIDFFDFQFIMNADGTLKETKFKGQPIDMSIGSGLFLIKEKYFKKVKQHKLDKKTIENLKNENEKNLKSWTHKKHCYQQTMYEHQKTLNHYRWTVRAFEQLAKANEESQKEIAYNKSKGGFSI